MMSNLRPCLQKLCSSVSSTVIRSRSASTVTTVLPSLNRPGISLAEGIWRMTVSQFHRSASVRYSAPESSKADGESKPEESDPQGLRAKLAEFEQEAAKLKEKASDFEDKYLRSLAEMENLRTRMNKQIQDGKLYATQKFCKDLADIKDILQLAIDSVPNDQLGTNKNLKELYEGLKMTDAQLLKVFKSHGLNEINPLGEKFNPNEHEAIVQQEQPGKESGSVIFVTKIGYKLHDRVIRPAVVGVAK